MMSFVLMNFVSFNYVVCWKTMSIMSNAQNWLLMSITLSYNSKQTSNKLNLTSSLPTSNSPLLWTYLDHKNTKIFLLIFTESFNIANHQNNVPSIYHRCSTIGLLLTAPRYLDLHEWQKQICIKSGEPCGNKCGPALGFLYTLFTT